MADNKIDLVKTDKEYYGAKGKPEFREFGDLGYLSIEGKGAPAGDEYLLKVKALYPMAYGVKKISKKTGRDFAVPKLEGLWWVESDQPALEVPREEWHWRLLIRMPEHVTSDMVEQAREEVVGKKGVGLAAEVRFEKIREGSCVQIMHSGPYSEEPETLGKIEAFMESNRLRRNGLHHEIYLSDPTKTEPSKMKTILRQPVCK